MSPFERAARAEKVAALVVWLNRVGANPSTLEGLSEQEWVDIAAEAGVNKPSLETRHLVIAAMKPVEGYGLDSDDPFFGLPSAS